ncbi:hypothetical protein [Burkholderia ambifaria]|uniref:hypothetical protein n=1 Tax=Burkholderia ambifaria TaxID=152480 RepID=UPI00158C497D|nr:hypothetical protein [Burkholderia ambifaria]
MSKALIDTDVLLKTASYKLLKQLLVSAPLGSKEFGMIAAAQFVVSGKFKKKLKEPQLAEAKAHFQEAIASIAAIEPSSEELALAARLESAALGMGVDLDLGESQICALMVSRGVDLMMTGDKRAIKAIAALKEHEACAYAHGKVACLEQLVLWMIAGAGLEAVQTSICALPAVDTSLNIALGCYSQSANLESCQEGLMSYINYIRTDVPRVLIAYPA